MATGADKARGDEMVAFLEANWREFGIQNIIWWREINTGSGWKPYDHTPYMRSGKGSPDEQTQMHGDHIHCQLSNIGTIEKYHDV